MNKFSVGLVMAGLFALPFAIGVSVSRQAHAARHGCPQLDKYMKRIKGAQIPNKVYFLKVSGLDDSSIPKRARARFAKNLLAEGQKKDGFFADLAQDGCRSLTFTFLESKKYNIRSSSATTLVLEGADHAAIQRGTLQLTSEKLEHGTVLLNLTFDYKFVDACQDGSIIVKPVTVRALFAWGSLDINEPSERAASATTAQLAAYADEWEEATGCEKHDAEVRGSDKHSDRDHDEQEKHHRDPEPKKGTKEHTED